MSDVKALCDICGRNLAEHTCSLCGRRVCNTHYDQRGGLCTSCKAGKSIAKK